MFGAEIFQEMTSVVHSSSVQRRAFFLKPTVLQTVKRAPSLHQLCIIQPFFDHNVQMNQCRRETATGERREIGNGTTANR